MTRKDKETRTGMPAEAEGEVVNVEAAVEEEGGQRAFDEKRVPNVLEQADVELQRDLREAHIEITEEHLQQAQIILDPDTKLYKSFDPSFGERFYIARCGYQGEFSNTVGDEVDEKGFGFVVKISAPDDEGAIHALQHEKKIFALLNEMERKSRRKEEEYFSFLQMDHGWNYDSQECLVTEYAEDDEEYREGLSAEERAKILIDTIKWMHTIPVDQALLDLPRDEQTLKVRNASEHKWQVRGFAREYVESGTITQDEVDEIVALFDTHAELIDSFPMVVTHGDLHGGNIRVNRKEFNFEDFPDEGTEVTVIDLESAELNNSLFDLATISVYADLGSRVGSFVEAEPLLAQLEKNWLGPSNDGMKETIIDEIRRQNEDRIQDALKVYHLMRIARVMRSLPTVKPEQRNPLQTIATDIFLPMLKEDLKALRSE